MAERLSLVTRKPARVLDFNPHCGASRDLLAAAYPQARIVDVVDSGLATRGRAEAPAPWWSPRRWRAAAAPETCPAEALGPGSGDLLWANMALHGWADPQARFAAWQSALAVDGFLMFSTLGPGTLESLATLYRERGWPPPFAPFVDMHDLGDMLVESGFADPVMDQETITLTWPDAAAALAELRSLGGNADPRRFGGLRTPRWRDALLGALASTAGADGRPRLAFEVVYGHAFRVAPRPRVTARTEIAVDDLRTMARQGKQP